MKNGATRMVMVVDTTAVTWNMVIASGVLAFLVASPIITALGNNSTKNSGIHSLSGKTRSITVSPGCRRLEGNLVRMVH